MNAQIFAEWFERQGYRVLRTKSSYWLEAFSHVYQAFPYHWLIQPDKEEFRILFKTHNALGLRYSTPFDGSCGAISYHIVYEGNDYPLNDLPKQSRKNVRKAMRQMAFEPISFRNLATEGWQSRAETLERQGRTKAENQGWWRRLCLSAEGLEGFEAWAVIIDRNPVASLITFICDNCCSILYQQCQTNYLKTKANNFLVYAFTKEVTKRSSINFIFSGMHSLNAPYSLDEFKFSMCYKAKLIRQRVLANRIVTPLFTNNSLKIITRILEKRPNNTMISKTAGMIKLFLEGRRPFEEQNWPRAVIDQRSKLLKT